METRVGDIVLVYLENSPVGYARVEDISADIKPEWWSLSLLLLKLPVQNVTWILREEYIEGQPFSMGGQMMRLERLPRPKLPLQVTVDEYPQQKDAEDQDLAQPTANVIDLHSRKKKHKPGKDSA